MMKRKILPYNPKLKPLAQSLRQNMTLSEILLWQEINQKKVQGIQFSRQIPILDYIVDFYSKDLCLAIEIDGDSHNHKYKQDKYRQSKIENLGVKFLRFDDKEVKNNMLNVLRVIHQKVLEEMNLKGFVRPTPAPPERGVKNRINK